MSKYGPFRTAAEPVRQPDDTGCPDLPRPRAAKGGQLRSPAYSRIRRSGGRGYDFNRLSVPLRDAPPPPRNFVNGSAVQVSFLFLASGAARRKDKSAPLNRRRESLVASQSVPSILTWPNRRVVPKSPYKTMLGQGMVCTSVAALLKGTMRSQGEIRGRRA